MHTTILAAALMALALVGCTAPPASTVRQADGPAAADTPGRPPIAHVTAPTDPDIALSDDAAEPAAYDLDDPEDAAAALIIDGLADEGLLATSIDTQVLTRDDRHSQVQVEAAHSPGRGHPIQSSYLLELERDRDGWQVVTYAEPG